MGGEKNKGRKKGREKGHCFHVLWEGLGVPV